MHSTDCGANEEMEFPSGVSDDWSTGHPATNSTHTYTHVHYMYPLYPYIHTYTHGGTPSIITIILTNYHAIIMELLKDYVLRKLS